MMFPKENKWRNKKYTDWVKQQTSVVSGMPADDPHHIMGYGLTGGTKAPDWAVIPLTRQEHTALHNDPQAWEQEHGSQIELLFSFWKYNFDEIKRFLK